MTAPDPDHPAQVESVGGVPVERWDRLASTSRTLRHRVTTVPVPRAPFAAVAREQSGGVGRLGRAWSSPPGGLWVTAAVPCDAAGTAGTGLALRAGVTVAESIEAAALDTPGDPPAQLKWPNDVLVRSRKVAGILAEIVQSPAGPWILLGVGINSDCRCADLPEPLRDRAGTLRDITGRPVDNDRLLRALVPRLVSAAAPTDDRSLLDRARSRLAGVGSTARATMPDGRTVKGLLEGLDADGRAVLIVEGARWIAPVSCELDLEPP